VTPWRRQVNWLITRLMAVGLLVYLVRWLFERLLAWVKR
jgi:hypothetical protein